MNELAPAAPATAPTAPLKIPGMSPTVDTSMARSWSVDSDDGTPRWVASCMFASFLGCFACVARLAGLFSALGRTFSSAVMSAELRFGQRVP
jgi:hypothetical protein